MLTCFFEASEAPAELRHAVVNCLVISGGQVLLTRRSKKVLIQPDKWCLPGGFVDRDETVAAAAAREAQKETGYSVKIKSLLRINDQPQRRQEPSQNVAFEFIAEPLQKSGRPDKEVSEVKWFDLDFLPSAKDFAFDHLETIKEYKKLF